MLDNKFVFDTEAFKKMFAKSRTLKLVERKQFNDAATKTEGKRGDVWNVFYRDEYIGYIDYGGTMSFYGAHFETMYRGYERAFTVENFKKLLKNILADKRFKENFAAKRYNIVMVSKNESK